MGCRFASLSSQTHDKVVLGRLVPLRFGLHTPAWGLMNFGKVVTTLSLFSAVSLVSCSGPRTTPPPCTVNCGGGNATVSLTLTAAPLTPLPNTNLLSFIVDINTITLTSTTGTSVNIPLNATVFAVDLTKLQSDSVFLGTSATVPADSYASITVSISNPVVTFCTQTQGTMGCAAGSVTTVSGAVATPKISSAPFPLTLTASQKTGLAINFNLANALTVNASQVVTAVNLGATNVLSARTLPPSPSSLAVGQLDFVEDVTGIVTAVNATTQSVTVHTSTRGSLTAVANSSTVFSPNCTAFNLSLSFSSCVAQGQVASLDTVLNSDGTFTLLEYDPLSTTTGDWIEGVITASPSSSTQFTLVANDLVLASSGSLIGSSAPLSAQVNVGLVTPNPFLVDTKGFTVPVNNFTGTDASILLPGQTLSVHVTAFTAASGSTPATVSVDRVYLRFTRVSGTVAAAGTQASFNIQNLPSFFGVPTSQLLVEITQGAPPTIPATNFDGVGAATALSNPQTVSIRALYFGGPGTPTPSAMPFSAAKVRVP
jgi:hypothetical protein